MISSEFHIILCFFVNFVGFRDHAKYQKPCIEKLKSSYYITLLSCREN